jgi:hypothetical protein
MTWHFTFTKPPKLRICLPNEIGAIFDIRRAARARHPGKTSKNSGDVNVNERTVVPGGFRPPDRRPRASVEPKRSTAVGSLTAALVPGVEAGSGMEVHEQELGTVRAQHMYKMRCECGRSWFTLELPRLVQCPACHRLSLVSE